jgi:hypothetical protein
MMQARRKEAMRHHWLTTVLLLCTLALPALPPAAAQEGVTIEPVSTLGGRLYELTAEGSMVYVSEDQELTILDMSDPSRPVYRSRLPLPANATDMHIADGMLYLTLYGVGLVIVDVSNPDQPYIRGSYQSERAARVRRLHLAKERIYLHGDHSILMLDVRAPDHPVLLWEYTTGIFQDYSIVVKEDYLYISRQYHIVIVDISDPANPVQISQIDKGDEMWPGPPMQVVGDYLYAGHASGIYVFDVSNPKAPVLLTYHRLGYSDYLQVAGDLMYRQASGGSIEIWDVSDPVNITFLSSTDLSVTTFADLARVGNMAYVLTSDNTVQAVDISNPASPAPLGRYRTPSYAVHIFTDDGMAYVDTLRAGLFTVDVRQPGIPRIRGWSREQPEESSTAAELVADKLVYTTGAGYVYIFDVRDSDRPAQIGSYEAPTFAQGVTVDRARNLAFFTDIHRGLHVLDVRDPTNPLLLGKLYLPGFPNDVQVSGDLAYVTFHGESLGIGGGLHIVDISDPANMTLVNTYNVRNDVHGVDMVGILAYLTVDEQGLQIVDVHNPMHPELRASIPLGAHPQGIQVVDSRAYVANGSDGVAIIDVHNFTRPRLLASYNYDQRYDAAVDIEVVNDLLYVSDRYGGMRILRVKEPAHRAYLPAIIMTSGMMQVRRKEADD